MDRESRLRTIIEKIQSNGLSRNKHYELYEKAEYRSARERGRRLEKLLSLLDKADAMGWSFSLENARPKQGWQLTCTNARMRAWWTAHLYDFELDLLWRHPRGRDLLVIGADAEIVSRI